MGVFRRLQAFNSLFEMQDGVRYKVEVEERDLSILYLRCEDTSRRGLSRLSITFNSLFEMPELYLAGNTAVLAYVLSILYLRCVVAPHRQGDVVSRYAFNSLFEMPMNISARCGGLMNRTFNSLFEMPSPCWRRGSDRRWHDFQFSI